MVTKGLLVRLRAKAGKEQELQQFLEGALPIVEGEPDTTAWFAVRFSDSEFGIFDVFPDESGRQTHLNGQVAAALGQHGPALLDGDPQFEPIDVLASKLPASALAGRA
jgi:quinol monooxygenase YgiN